MGEVSDASTGWSEHPDAIESRAVPPEAAGSVRPTRVVGVGAICDLRVPESGDERTQSFSVSEYLRWDDGQRVMLHHDRGFTIGSSTGAVRGSESPASITRTVLNVVLPDDDDVEESHPWAWLAELARIQGVSVTAEDLRSLPYDVVLTEELMTWLGGT
jgi:hypothetical protein